MDCRAAQKLIDFYIDGMLGGAQAQRIERHVGACPGCKQALDDALRLKRALGALADREPPAGLAQAAIRKARRRPVAVYVSAATAVAAAAVALVAVFATGGGEMGGASPGMQESIMYSDESFALQMAPEAPAMEAPEAAAGAPMAAEMADDAALPGQERSLDGGAAALSALRVFDTERDFAAARGAGYYRPESLPPGASLESISDDGHSVVFTCRLSGGDAYYFEWLATAQDGVESELIRLFGDAGMFMTDEGFYTLYDAGMAIVYWEQRDQVFRVIAPERVTGVKAYCAAIWRQP